MPNKPLAEKPSVREVCEGQEHLHPLYEEAPIPFQSLDRDGRILIVNQAWLAMLGYSREEVLGRAFSEFLVPESVESFKENFPRFKTAGSIHGTEFKMVRKDGADIVIMAHGRIVHDENGNFKQTHCILHDVSEFKRTEDELDRYQNHLEKMVEERTSELMRTAEDLRREIEEHERTEKALRESEERLRLVIQNMPVIMNAFDEEGNIIVWNKEAQRVTGYTADEMRAMPGGLADMHLMLESRDHLLEILAKRGADYKPLELDFTCKDGSIKTMLSFNISKLFPIQGWYSWAIGVDITDRKKAEEELRKYDQQLREMVEARTQELKEANIQLELEITERIQAEETLRESEEHYRALIEKTPIVCFTFDRKGGILGWNQAAEEVYGYSKEEAIGANAYDLIVTPETKESTDELIRRVFAGESVVGSEWQDRNKQGEVGWRYGNAFPLLSADGKVLCGVNMNIDITKRKLVEEKLQASLQEKEVLLKEIHHRVKNNLQTISSLLDLQSESIEDPKAREVFNNSQNRVKSMALIHEKLYQNENLASIDFGGYVERLVSHLFEAYGGPEYSVKPDISVGDVSLNLDTAIPCGLMICELVSNALKHAFPNGRKGEIRVELRAEQSDQYTLVVSDDGIGFPENLDLNKPPSLGLQLMNMLVKQLRGTIELKGGPGTIIEVTFAERQASKGTGK